MDYVFGTNRIDVVDQNSLVDFETVYTKVATVVSYDDLITDPFPKSRSVERLIDPTIESESFYSDSSSDGQVSKTFFEGLDSSKFSIRPNRHSRLDEGPGLSRIGKRS